MQDLSERLTIETLQGLQSQQPGIYDVVVIHNRQEEIAAAKPVSMFGLTFLSAIKRSLDGLGGDFGTYTTGGMYYRVINLPQKLPEIDRGGEFHFDTRRDESDLRATDGPLRIVSVLTSDGSNVSNVFSRTGVHRGFLAAEVIDEHSEDLIQPDNGSLVLFDEELDLHARPPAVIHKAGAIAVFASAVLRKPTQEVVTCVALTNDNIMYPDYSCKK